jgi:anti-anti-sigma regulatory factor
MSFTAQSGPFQMGLDVGTIGALARCQLVARRCGCEIRLVDPLPELVELIELAGLRQVLRQAEAREELVGVEEEGQLDDPPA